MKLTERDKVLVLVVPAFMVAAAYGWLVMPGKRDELKRAETSLERARAAAPSASQLFAEQAALTGLSAQIDRQQKELLATRERWHAAVGRCADPARRNERIQKLTGLLARCELSFVEDTETPDGGKDHKLSPALEGLTQQIAKLSGNQKPQLRRVRFLGRYLDVHKALGELNRGEVLAIPVGLTMKEAPPATDRQEWTLLVWI